MTTVIPKELIARLAIVCRAGVRLLVALLLLGVAATAQAEDCSEYPNGFADPNPPSNINVVHTAKWDFGTYEIATQ